MTALFGPPSPAGRSEIPLRVLIVASLVIPALIFAIASWLAYRAHFEDARDRLNRTIGLVQEHAVKVFDTFEISERYMELLFEGHDDEDIRAHEGEFSKKLSALAQSMPQVRDLWVIGADGRPLVSGAIYPLPRDLDLSDRDYFKAHLTGDVRTYISMPIEGRAVGGRFFGISRKRPLKDGRFDGVFLISIAPDYFTQFYGQLPGAEMTITALVRTDGTILARYPSLPRMPAQVSRNTLALRGITEHPEGGIIQGFSPIDHQERLLAFRRLPRYDAYVVTGIGTAAIKAEWLRAMSQHLIFGIPATLTMFVLSLMALSYTRREAAADAKLREESARRHSTELALQQAQKMEAVGQLTGGVAHDFNNLLTIIGGNLDTIRRRLLEPLQSDEARKLASSLAQPLERAQFGTQSATQLTHRLLAFSRRQPLRPERVDLNSLVAGISDLLRRTLGEEINIETVLAGGLWPTFVDRNQVENAILNLAINARDAMPGGGRLTIETANVYLDEAYVQRFGDVAAGQYVMLSVTDSGSGIPSDILEKVFEPFFTTKGTGQGSGLGLAMVHGFVKQSGGHVRIYSEVGEGTTVKIYLPRMTATEETAAAPAAKPVVRAAALGARPGETILVVEDSDGVREYATSVLEELGYAVLAASNAEEALAVVAHGGRIDLLFTDVVLPGSINGRELATKIVSRRRHLPVLFTTGYTRNAIIHHGRLDADVNLLGKPYTQQDLARKVRELLDAAAGRQE